MKRSSDKCWNKIEYYLAKGYSILESEAALAVAIRKASWLCIEHWIAKGYTEEQAREQISLKQSIISKRQTGKPKNERTRLAISIANKKRSTDEYWIEKFGDNWEIEFNKNKKQLIQNGVAGMAARVANKEDFRKSNHLCLEYWISRGYTEEQGKEQISLKQIRNLKSYTAKYGEDEGQKRWSARNIKWSNTMAALDQTELNAKRRKNAHSGYYTQDTIQKNNINNLLFYVLDFTYENERFIKFGITKKESIYKRWDRSLPFNIIITKRMPALLALELENKIKLKYKSELYFPSNIRTREAVKVEHLHTIQEMIYEFVETNSDKINLCSITQ